MTLNETEQKYYSHLFSLADTGFIILPFETSDRIADRDGKVSGKEGAPFLRKSELSDKALEKIWAASDTEATGFLHPKEFAIAMRLVAHAQYQVQNQKKNNLPVVEPDININNIKNVMGLPKFKDIPTPSMFPIAFSQEDIHKYDHLFMHADTNHDGFVDGNEAKAYFSKAKITTEKLARIWELSEQDGDSKLNICEFRIAMHLIYWTLKNEELPQSIPPSLVESSKSIPPSATQPAANQFVATPPQSQPQTNYNQQYNFNQPAQNYNAPAQQGNMNNFGGNFGFNDSNFPINNNEANNRGGMYYQGNVNQPQNNFNQAPNNQYYNNNNMPNNPYQQQGNMNPQMNQGGFVQSAPKLGDPNMRGNIQQYALPGASFETRANFQNDLTKAVQSRPQGR
ncbi:putative partner of ralbp-1 [Planoprotostelium fungivorum]|uniref:Putative partner of ralbp-1 n=1 Tax=Planoprotostelium fungivorum TaxID=1890364 RepID=A0A2P6MSY6_9EUKA|nr:putative partner of ralbp-1 [Planoprotostelium fungivorum]